MSRWPSSVSTDTSGVRTLAPIVPAVSTPKTRPRVALVCDFEVTLHGLRQVLRPQHDSIELVEWSAAHHNGTRIDVALYDPVAAGNLRRWSHLQALVDDPRVNAVALYTGHVPSTWVERARSIGVQDVISKSLRGRELVAALRRVGESAPARRPTPAIRSSAEVDNPPEYALTQREAEILGFIASGISNEAIAARLYLSINTVKSHIRTAYQRIGVQTRAQAVAWAIHHGLAAPDPVS